MDEGIVKSQVKFMEYTKRRKVCPACGKLHTYCNKAGYCVKHAKQIYLYGHVLDRIPRSIYDPNEYRVEGNSCYISVYDKIGNKLDKEVIIDTEDMSRILRYKVYVYQADGNWYAKCNIARNIKVPVHRILCEAQGTVDHINGDTLDNRKQNLREASMTTQNLNKRTTKGIQCSKSGKFAATMTYKGKRYMSRYYNTVEEARFYRYLLLQLLPFTVNFDTSFIKDMTNTQITSIRRDFENRFKNRVL